MIVEVTNVNKSFDDKKVLDKVSLNLEKGYITGLVGRNGAGKTTLLKILAGIYKEDSGSIKIAGKSLKENPKAIKHLAYLPDSFDYFNYYKIYQLPEYYKILYPTFDTEFFNKELERLSFDQKASIRNLSKGEKNILGLIVVLASNADAILVDEVLDGMDVLNKRLISEYLLYAKEKGCAVFVSSHELGELSGICDFIYYLSKDGKLIETREDKNKALHKLQVVVKDHLPEDISKKAVIISDLGRVYTILLETSDEQVKKLLADEQIVQYDKLQVKIEDYFYLEQGAK